MKYKLLGQNELSLYTILQNRHIEDPRAYLNLTEDVINDYKLFGLDNLKNAATMILKTIRANGSAVMLVD